MLTLRRKASKNNCSDQSTIDIEYKHEIVTLSLREIFPDQLVQMSVWWLQSTDWGDERFPPRYIVLTDNQPLVINSWLKIYGSKINEANESVMHIQAPDDAIINRRDRK